MSWIIFSLFVLCCIGVVSSGVVSGKVTAPQSPNPLRTIEPSVSWSEITGVERSSRSAICHAQCMAKCQDIQLGVPPMPANTSHENGSQSESSHGNISEHGVPFNEDIHGSCIELCDRYLDDGWMDQCDNSVCLSTCQFLTNNTVQGWRYIPHPPDNIKLIQKDPRTVRIQWDIQSVDQNHTLLYVLEWKDQEADTWSLLNRSTVPWYVTYLDVCEQTAFRVAAVNQFGTKGFSSEVARTDLPVPGSVTKVRNEVTSYYSPDFYFSFNFDPPEGWDIAGDIERYKFTAAPLKCDNNLRPPIPVLLSMETISKENQTMALWVKIHESGYRCAYLSNVIAESKCKVLGEKYNFTIDLTDCHTIKNYECLDAPFIPPDPVTNVIAIPLAQGPVAPKKQQDNQSWPVEISWTPPVHLGSAGVINHYVVQWGFMEYISPGFPNPQLTQEGRATVKPSLNSTVIYVLQEQKQYGVKVIVVVPGQNASEVETQLSLGGIQAEFYIEENPDEDEHDNKLVVIYVLIPLAAIVCTLIGSVLYVRRHSYFNLKQKPRSLVDNPLYPSTNGFAYSAEGPAMDEWEVSPSCLEIGDEILGRGAFGVVTKGTLMRDTDSSPITVAVKLLKDADNDLSLRGDFLLEMAMMKRIGSHPNVLSLVGAVTLNPQLCLLLEHAPHGDLLHYLREHRLAKNEDRLCLHDLLGFARQIAMGMDYLAGKGFVHRDLASRNILVGENKVAKIGDFGLTRFIYDDKIYVTKRAGKLPLKWMAIESIFDLTFTTASDVWSYGVVLFELTTLGGTPYPTISHADLLPKLLDGYRMEKPDNCTTQLYSVMRRCWQQVPSNRPSFSQLRDAVDELLAGGEQAHEYLSIDGEEDLHAKSSDGEEEEIDFSNSSVFSNSVFINNSGGSSDTSLPIINPISKTNKINKVNNKINKKWRLPDPGPPPPLPRRATAPDDFLRVSTCSNDELLPPASPDQGVSSWPAPSSPDQGVSSWPAPASPDQGVSSWPVPDEAGSSNSIEMSTGGGGRMDGDGDEGMGSSWSSVASTSH